MEAASCCKKSQLLSKCRRWSFWMWPPSYPRRRSSKVELSWEYSAWYLKEKKCRLCATKVSILKGKKLLPFNISLMWKSFIFHQQLYFKMLKHLYIINWILFKYISGYILICVECSLSFIIETMFEKSPSIICTV